MRWERVVTYQVEADSLEEALELWNDDGPECGNAVNGVHATAFEAVED